jgi:hypothetical protein
MRMTPRFSISWSWSAFAAETDVKRQAAPASAINSFFMMFTRYVSMKQKIL